MSDFALNLTPQYAVRTYPYCCSRTVFAVSAVFRRIPRYPIYGRSAFYRWSIPIGANFHILMRYPVIGRPMAGSAPLRIFPILCNVGLSSLRAWRSAIISGRL